MARLADLQRQIDEATEEVCLLVQDEQDRRPQHRELHQEGLFNEDGWYDDFNHDAFTFDDASTLAAVLKDLQWWTIMKLPVVTWANRVLYVMRVGRWYHTSVRHRSGDAMWRCDVGSCGWV